MNKQRRNAFREVIEKANNIKLEACDSGLIKMHNPYDRDQKLQTM